MKRVIRLKPPKFYTKLRGESDEWLIVRETKYQYVIVNLGNTDVQGSISKDERKWNQVS